MLLGGGQDDLGQVHVGVAILAPACRRPRPSCGLRRRRSAQLAVAPRLYCLTRGLGLEDAQAVDAGVVGVVLDELARTSGWRCGSRRPCKFVRLADSVARCPRDRMSRQSPKLRDRSAGPGSLKAGRPGARWRRFSWPGACSPASSSLKNRLTADGRGPDGEGGGGSAGRLGGATSSGAGPGPPPSPTRRRAWRTTTASRASTAATISIPPVQSGAGGAAALVVGRGVFWRGGCAFGCSTLGGGVIGVNGSLRGRASPAGEGSERLRAWAWRGGGGASATSSDSVM